MSKILKNIDKKLLLFSAILFIIGLIMVFSSSNVSAFMRYQYNNPASFFIRQLIFLILGVIVFSFGIRFSTKSYGILSWFGIIGISIILFCLLIYGTAINDAVSWIGYKGFGIQPSEFAKIILITLIPTYYEINKSRLDDAKIMIIPILIGLGIAGLVALQNDLGTAGIIVLIIFFMFMISKINDKVKNKILIFTGIFLFSSCFILFTFGKNIFTGKLERLNFFNPCDRFVTTGNQVCNGYIAINNSSGIGKGLGNSTQKYLYLAESHTDFIYAILIEELGLGGMIGLFILYIIILARIIVIGKNSYRDDHAMICYGIAFYLFIHITINLGGVLGLMPLTGITLPFMSYGGSFTLSLIIGLTMIQRIRYETNRIDKKLVKK